jgi:hypothetical protein
MEKKMATKKTKKKSEKEVIAEVSKLIAEETLQATDFWPKVNIGSHLTVIEYEDGKTELIWDDEALARDVREALKNA